MITTTSFPTSGTPTIDASSLQTAATRPSRQAFSSSDTVHLSQTAQATALHHQGMSVKQIAANLGITAQEVDSYLGIMTVSSAASAVAASSSSQGSSAAGSSATLSV